jgi:hypothetical protein
MRRTSVRPWTHAIALLVVTLIVVGCSTIPSTGPSPGLPLTEVELRYELIDELGSPVFCDPDQFPVGRDPMTSMRERWAEIMSDPATFSGIATRLGLDPRAALGDDERLRVYEEWKILRTIALQRLGTGYEFDHQAIDAGLPEAQARHVAGSIGLDGSIRLRVDEPVLIGGCPICLVRGTLIATPVGDVPVEDLAPGMLVWTMDRSGGRIEATVLATGSVEVGPGHVAARVELADGRAVTASAGHPLADGRTIGSLRVGDVVDGSTVGGVTWMANEDGWTFDLLPTGSSAAYWANGVPVASTLAGR